VDAIIQFGILLDFGEHTLSYDWAGDEVSTMRIFERAKEPAVGSIVFAMVFPTGSLPKL
jgi:hypothetical protein